MIIASSLAESPSETCTARVLKSSQLHRSVGSTTSRTVAKRPVGFNEPAAPRRPAGQDGGMPRSAIATPEPQATAAGERVLATGGNALDAALAAAAVLTVTFPHNCALGGDLFALVRAPSGETVSVNASGPAGSA